MLWYVKKYYFSIILLCFNEIQRYLSHYELLKNLQEIFLNISRILSSFHLYLSVATAFCESNKICVQKIEL